MSEILILSKWINFNDNEDIFIRELHFYPNDIMANVYYEVCNEDESIKYSYHWNIYPNDSISTTPIISGNANSIEEAMNEVDKKLLEYGYRFIEEDNIGLLI